jgi:hypothetical protein
MSFICQVSIKYSKLKRMMGREGMLMKTKLIFLRTASGSNSGERLKLGGRSLPLL